MYSKTPCYSSFSLFQEFHYFNDIWLSLHPVIEYNSNVNSAEESEKYCRIKETNREKFILTEERAPVSHTKNSSHLKLRHVGIQSSTSVRTTWIIMKQGPLRGLFLNSFCTRPALSMFGHAVNCGKDSFCCHCKEGRSYRPWDHRRRNRQKRRQRSSLLFDINAALAN